MFVCFHYDSSHFMNYSRIYLAIRIIKNPQKQNKTKNQKKNPQTIKRLRKENNYNSKGHTHFFRSSDTHLMNIVPSMGKILKGIS